MHPHTQARSSGAQPHAPFGRPADQPTNYSPIPQRLIADLRDSPLAIGLYALVGRLYLVHQVPVPLSRADVLRYDPTLKAGAVKRAFDRLVGGGWLAEANQEGRKKQRYTPTWGRIKGAPLPWRMDEPCLGRPRHIARLPLDRGLLDVCMGKLTPHATQPATITRYVTTPALSLTDVGCYALTLAEIPQATPRLRWLGIVRDGRALPLPAEQRLLAIISQRPLTLDDNAASACDTELTVSGTRRLGLAPLPPPEDEAGRAHPLFFVPPGLIGSLIGPLIGSLIGHGAKVDEAPSAQAPDEIRSDVRPEGITWGSNETKDSGTPPPTPPEPTQPGGGGIEERTNRERVPARAARQRAGQEAKALLAVPDTEATRLLRTINVRPEQLIELAEMPIAPIHTAIADGQAREGVRDLAGWVVSLLRAHRDHGWKIAPPAPRSDSPEALRAAFARYAVEQEAARHADTDGTAQPWFPPPAPALLDLPGALTRLWNEVQAVLKIQTTRAEFNTWVRRMALHSVDGCVATIVVPNDLVKDAVERRFLPQLRDLLTMQIGESVEVRVILSGSRQEGDHAAVPDQNRPPASHPTQPNQPPGPALDPALRPDWIGVGQWATLPAMLRAALIGSTLANGEIQAASPHLGRLLRTRYAREVAELIVVHDVQGMALSPERDCQVDGDLAPRGS